jgi:hypothetical protein
MNNNIKDNSSHHHNSTMIKKNTITEINKILNTEGKYTISSGVHDHGNKLESIRKDEYKGHKIAITTTYDIEVDGKKIFPPIHISNNGSVGTHTLPNYVSSSAIELVKTLIDCFPEEFKGSN